MRILYPVLEKNQYIDVTGVSIHPSLVDGQWRELERERERFSGIYFVTCAINAIFSFFCTCAVFHQPFQEVIYLMSNWYLVSRILVGHTHVGRFSAPSVLLNATCPTGNGTCGSNLFLLIFLNPFSRDNCHRMFKDVLKQG